VQRKDNLSCVLVGIDEAGFGPLLGPLVVSATVWQLPTARSGDSLWEMLCEAVTPRVDRRDLRLAILDSKRLFAGRRTLAPLERAALVTLAAVGQPVKTFHQMLKTVAPGTIDKLNAYPWYRGFDFDLPLSDQTGDVPTRANSLRRAMRHQHIVLKQVMSKPLLTLDYNRLVSATGNKSRVIMDLVFRIVDRVMRCFSQRYLRFVCDRLGGRTRYRGPLMTAFAEHQLQITEESQTRSAYRLCRDERICDIEFVTKGEDHCMATALAGIYSKYLRELFMHAFNRSWAQRVEGIKPTAGYFVDGQRFLNDVADVLGPLNIDRSDLVRTR